MKSVQKVGLFLATAAACISLGHAAQAQRISTLTGKSLGTLCSQKAGARLCDAYLAGVADSEVWSHNFDKLEGVQAPTAFCVPKNVKGEQIRSLLVGWLVSHQDALAQPAGRAVYRALHENYPCSSTITPAAKAVQPGGMK